MTWEDHLFYRFKRKNDVWYSKSCTLNSWIEALSGKELSDMVFNAGIRGSDQSKADLINMMPFNLWKKVLPKLERLTPYDGQPWTSK